MTTRATTISSATTKATTETSPAAEATATAEAAAEASTHTAEAATSTESSAAGAGKSIFTNLEHAALPVVAVELLDCVTGVIRTLENDNARALRSAVRAHVHVRTNDTTNAG